jgi:oligopeptide/dipeptide ABC transporter ATP-binding protein
LTTNLDTETTQRTGDNGRPAIVVEDLVKRFVGRRRGQPEVLAVNGVSFSVPAGTSLGLVGESGSGKSTVARCVLGLLKSDAGTIEVLGRQIVGADATELRSWRRDMQIVFQEPYESLDPRIRVGAAIAEPLLIHTELRGHGLSTRVQDLMELVALDGALRDRYPHELSGGQQQRVNIARALATHPSVVVLDEPTSSLDVSVRAEILRLLLRLQHELHLTFLFISHDLHTIRSICDRVAVMYHGRLVEEGPVAEVLHRPAHPYTEFLLGSELPVDPDVKPLTRPVRGEHGPHAGEGCVFARRCPLRVDDCEEEQPPLVTAGPKHVAACIFVGTGRHARDLDERGEVGEPTSPLEGTQA